MSDDNNQQAQIQPDPLPPDIKVIECPASTAQYKSEDNSKWTNILKESLHIQKGSEIKVSTNFIDQRGIDGDIIQFTATGNQQDNTHTILTQVYTTNDGYNGKTTSYDYMSRNIEGIELLDPGQDVGGISFQANFTNVSSSGADFSGNVNVVPYCIRPGNISISSGGVNYINGSLFTIASGSGDDFEGYIITGDIGEIVKLVFTKVYSSSNPGAPNTVIITGNTTGSGAIFSNTVTQNGYAFSSFVGTKLDSTRGSGYKRGDLLEISINSATATIASANRPQFRVGQVYNGEGGITKEAMFDQGYNYEKVPLQRWASNYDVNQNFSYGNNFGPRTFTKGDGQTITIQNPVSHHLNDSCISSATMILQREDEFAPGVFHQEFSDLQTNTNSAQAQISLYSPISYLRKAPTSTDTFTWGYNNFGVNLTVNNYDYVQNGITVKGNILNAYPPGSTLRVQFNDNVESTMTYQQQTVLDAEWNNLYGGCYIVKSSSRNATTTSLTLSAYVSDTYIGECTSVNIYGTSAVYPISSTTKVQLVYSADSDGLGSIGVVGPEIFISTNGSGNITSFSTQGDLNLGSNNRTGMVYTISGYASTDRVLCLKVDNTLGFYGSRALAFSNDDMGYISSGIREVNMFLIPTFNYGLKTDNELQQGDRRAYRYLASSATLGNYLPATILTQGITTTLSSESDLGITSYVSNGLYRKSGDTNSSLTSFKTSQASVSNHDTKTQLTITDTSDEFINQSFSYGNSSIFRPANAGTNTFKDSSGNYVMLINISDWNTAGFTIADLPLYTTLEITPTIAGAQQNDLTVQMETGGFQKHDATNYYILIKTPDLHNNYLTYFPINVNIQSSLGGATFFQDLDNVTLPNYENTSIDGVFINYAIPLYYNNQIKFKWINDSKELLNNGSIVATGPQNFFGLTDPNYSILESSNNNIVSHAPSSLKNSYDDGGYYFLTRFTGHLTNSDNTNEYQYDNSGINIFNNWGVFLPFAQLPPEHYSWRNDRISPIQGTPLTFTESNPIYNSNTAYTDASNFWSYQALYRQKSITIDKSFCVASDISGIWTNSAHDLKGAINPTSGEEYTLANQNPLLQNEFIFPVYGSNNLISPSGVYIPDLDIYPYTQGLEPGHVVGKTYLNSNNDWLAGPLQFGLPEDNLNKFYYVFFRTPFTFIRGYDPLANSSGAPDFTSLTTVNQTADKIGNANDSTATPGVSGNVALDGSTMLNAGVSPKQIGYELGLPAGNTSSVKFGTKQYYPIYYLDERNKSLYPKAKASQYVGSQNITLAFATDISAFTFQYLHTPYTSPFVDGLGGDESIRIFYGNRKNGIYNHETIGGLNVINFCRPDFPRSVFSYNEINDSTIQVSEYPYGINPLSDISIFGQRFLNKVGFTDANIGIVNNSLDSSSLKKTGYSITPVSRDITSKMDSGFFGETSVLCNNTIFNATTGSDIDSSDAILNQIPAPEINAGLESNNIKIVPNIGQNNYIIRKWGDMIFYPYSLNSDTNSFADKSIVRFDNASSTFGTIGGLMLSNSNRGMGLPNTIGSTFNTDDKTIPRTLNPDCELYLAYTIACASNFIQASLLPSKLPNGYLVVLSSLQKLTPFYMTKAGWVNAISVVNKTFLTGDFILSEGQLSFYTQEDMIISEITTEIKDTQFNSPTVLGENSTIIYQITNYSPTVPKPILTIEQEQQQDYHLMQMVQEHLDYLEGHSKSSPLQLLEANLQQSGISILQGGSNTAEVLQAMKNQIEFHDLPNLSKKELSQFLQTPEGKLIQSSASDLATINSQIGEIAQHREDLNILASSEPPGSAQVEYLENKSRDAISNVKRYVNDIRKRIPVNFFTKSQPLEEQIPGIGEDEEVNLETLKYGNFITQSDKRFDLYTNYKEGRITEGRNPLTYEEFQHFHYGNILNVDEVDRDKVERYDPELLPRIQGAGYVHPFVSKKGPNRIQEGGYAVPLDIRERMLRRQRERENYYLDSEEIFNSLEEPQAVRTLASLKQHQPDSGFASAYETIPDYMRPRHNEPGYFENLKKFTDEVKNGSADLTGIQKDILRESGIAYNTSVRGQKLAIAEDPKFSKRFLTSEDNPNLSKLGNLLNRPFDDEDIVKARSVISEFKPEIDRLFEKRKGRPTREIKQQREQLFKNIDSKLSEQSVKKREPLPVSSSPQTLRLSKHQLGAENISKTMAKSELNDAKEALGRIRERREKRRPVTRKDMVNNFFDIRTVRKVREDNIKRAGLMNRMAKTPTRGIPKTINEKE